MTPASRLVIPLTAAFCFAIDLVSKSWARAHLAGSKGQPLIEGFVRLSFTTNTGGAFGIGSGAGAIMTGLAFIVAAVVLFWAIKREAKDAPAVTERVGFGFLLGGAGGNLFERVTRGSVTDFLEFEFIAFPLFNLADVFIDAGIVLLLASYYVHRRSGLEGSPAGGRRQADDNLSAQDRQ